MLISIDKHLTTNAENIKWYLSQTFPLKQSTHVVPKYCGNDDVENLLITFQMANVAFEGFHIFIFPFLYSIIIIVWTHTQGTWRFWLLVKYLYSQSNLFFPSYCIIKLSQHDWLLYLIFRSCSTTPSCNFAAAAWV